MRILGPYIPHPLMGGCMHAGNSSTCGSCMVMASFLNPATSDTIKFYPSDTTYNGASRTTFLDGVKNGFTNSLAPSGPATGLKAIEYKLSQSYSDIMGAYPFQCFPTQHLTRPNTATACKPRISLGCMSLHVERGSDGWCPAS